MKKIFLTSMFSKVADELLNILPASPKDLTVAFIPTAADVYDDQWFLEIDRDKLKEMGFKIIELPLKDKTPAEVQNTLSKADVIFVAGGNTFYLLEQARKSGFVDIVPKLVEQGKVYVGSSAGSYIACPTIEVASWKNQDQNKVGLTDLTAMALVPFLMSAHYKLEQDESLKQGMANIKYPIKILTDEQAILVKGESIELVGEGEEIKLN